MKKAFLILSIMTLLGAQPFRLFAFEMIPEHFCSTGIQLYQKGKYGEALDEFKKALLIAPYYSTAVEYVKRIEHLETAPENKELPGKDKRIFPQVTEEKAVSPEPALKVSGSSMPLEAVKIEQNKSVIISGKNFKRFLVTNPAILLVEKKGADELLVTGKEVGYTYLQVWDDQGRRTLDFFTSFPRLDIETLEERMRSEEEKERNFRLNYAMDWATYERGNNVDGLSRTSYFFIQNFGLEGETPYGELDSALTANRFDGQDSLGHYTIGLTHGRIGDLEGFNLRGFDFFDFPPDFSSLIFPGIGLRGGMLSSAAMHDKLNYTVFAGRENWSGFGTLSPDINRRRDSYLDGFNLQYQPGKKQVYDVTLMHGFGKDRPGNLNDIGYDSRGRFDLGKWKFGVENAGNSEAFANLLKARFSAPKFTLGSEFRDLNKDFTSSTGSASRQGELGGLFDLNYEPLDKLILRGTFDVYRDRLYPAQDNPQRLNEDADLGLNYVLDPKTSLRMNYTLQNDLGKLSQYRYQNYNIGAVKTFRLIKDLNIYSDYYHREYSNYSSHASDYLNDRIYAGLRLNFSRYLYYYLNRDMNWLTESLTGDRSRPSATETGLDLSGRLGKSPFSGVVRFTYRNEEDTLSNVSFFSGEDYIEGYSELSYRPAADMERYASCRLRNVWADNPRGLERLEATINSGLRYIWDTGLSWQPAGDIDGFVFKDYNSDGIMQKNEAPVERIRIWLGRQKSVLTDIFGYYKFKGVRGRQAFISLDTSTIPPGFMLTVPASQGAAIRHKETIRLNFGISSRSEIYGFIFEDKNENGVYDKGELGVRGVVMKLEDNTAKVTDKNGRYSFSSVKTGKHILSLDLNSLPVYYLPKAAITKKITLNEGVSYVYNIPLKKNE
ncbi:MAG: SdrD B-like domain-containing protein [Candidatus Omnitrophica bacterium]|nr:SdrD B-like domain-containing protein [Candidatus Omnitrophota bacterium]